MYQIISLVWIWKNKIQNQILKSKFKKFFFRCDSPLSILFIFLIKPIAERFEILREWISSVLTTASQFLHELLPWGVRRDVIVLSVVWEIIGVVENLSITIFCLFDNFMFNFNFCNCCWWVKEKVELFYCADCIEK